MDLINIIGTLFDNSVDHIVALAEQIKDLRLGKNQQDINEDIYNQIQIVKEKKEKSKGYYDSYQSLIWNIPSPEIGDWAVVKNESNNHWYIYKCVVRGYWKETEEEYASEVNLNEYPKKSELKTINGQPIYGDGDIETGDRYDIASQNNDGLLSKELYVQLLEMRNETLPEIQEHLDNLLLLFDNEQTPESIQSIIDRYNQICEFIADLGDLDNGQVLQQIIADIDVLKADVESIEEDINTNVKRDLTQVKDRIAELNGAIEKINEDMADADASVSERFIHVYERIQDIENTAGGSLEEIRNDISGLNDSVESINTNIEEIDNNIDSIESNVSDLGDRVQQLEQNPSRDSIKHIFLTQSAYDALETYEEDTLYLIIEHTSGGSRLGEDTFPLILG